MAMFKTILTAVDFSDMSRDVLHYAARLAAASPGARLLVVNVVPDPLHEPWVVETAGVDWAQLQKDWVADAESRLDQLTTAEGLAPGTFTAVVLVGRPADAIVGLASDHAVDVVVIGTHGYGLVKHFVLGSVAERVLRRAECPVVTVPKKSLARLAQHDAEASVCAIS